MKKLQIILALLCGLLLPAALRAQDSPAGQASPGASAPDYSAPNSPAPDRRNAEGPPAQRGPAMTPMMEMLRSAQAELRASDEQLDQLLSEMNSSTGDRKVEAMSAILNRIVQDRKAMHLRLAALQSQMMQSPAVADDQAGPTPSRQFSQPPPSGQFGQQGPSGQFGQFRGQRSSSDRGNPPDQSGMSDRAMLRELMMSRGFGPGPDRGTGPGNEGSRRGRRSEGTRSADSSKPAASGKPSATAAQDEKKDQPKDQKSEKKDQPAAAKDQKSDAKSPPKSDESKKAGKSDDDDSN